MKFIERIIEKRRKKRAEELIEVFRSIVDRVLEEAQYGKIELINPDYLLGVPPHIPYVEIAEMTELEKVLYTLDRRCRKKQDELILKGICGTKKEYDEFENLRIYVWILLRASMKIGLKTEDVLGLDFSSHWKIVKHDGTL